MMETIDAVLKLFILGVTVSFGPCIAHCGAVILPYIAGTARGWKKGLQATLIFLLTRLAVYGVFGLLAGLVGWAIVEHLRQFEPQIMLVGGGFIAFLGLYIIFSKKRLHHCRLTSHKYSGKGPALLGLFTGVLPCLPLLGVLTFTALYAQDLWQGAFYGLAFGSGKLISPLVPLGILAATTPMLLMRYNKVWSYFTKLCGFVLLFMGISLVIF